MAGGDGGDGRRAEDVSGGVSEGVRQAVKLTSDRVHLLTLEATNSHVDVGSRVSRSRLGLALWSDADDLPGALV